MNSAIGADSSAGSTADTVEQRSRSRNYRTGYVDCIDLPGKLPHCRVVGSMSPACTLPARSG